MNKATHCGISGLVKLGQCMILFMLFLQTGYADKSSSVAVFPSTSMPIQLAAAPSTKSATRNKTVSNKKSTKEEFDHIVTGFELTGVHRREKCESCHSRGIFKGTPTTCDGCHTQGRNIASSVKPLNHAPTQQPCDQCHDSRGWSGARFDHSAVLPGQCGRCHNGSIANNKPAGHMATSASCETCHNTRAWTPAVFDHSAVTPGACVTCHNGANATGKPGGHLVTVESCDVCHSTRAWVPARYDHSAVTLGTCGNCHNGSTATGKPSGHIVTALSCDNCHSTRRWTPATFDHSSVTPGTCATCHNGSTATGKPSGHVITSASCDSCHSTQAWIPAGFDHSTVVPGTCSNCHNGSTATGKPGGHFVTTQQCDACHSTSRWIPTTSYSHNSAFFPGQHAASVSCIDCHTGNSETIAWRYSTYKPECAGCHANDFETGPHKKTETPSTIYYTVSELRDCTGSCHLYSDNTFTSITKTRSGEHRPSSSEF